MPVACSYGKIGEAVIKCSWLAMWYGTHLRNYLKLLFKQLQYNMKQKIDYVRWSVVRKSLCYNWLAKPYMPHQGSIKPSSFMLLLLSVVTVLANAVNLLWKYHWINLM